MNSYSSEALASGEWLVRCENSSFNYNTLSLTIKHAEKNKTKISNLRYDPEIFVLAVSSKENKK